jgi:hypothetical protein
VTSHRASPLGFERDDAGVTLHVLRARRARTKIGDRVTSHAGRGRCALKNGVTLAGDRVTSHPPSSRRALRWYAMWTSARPRRVGRPLHQLDTRLSLWTQRIRAQGRQLNAQLLSGGDTPGEYKPATEYTPHTDGETAGLRGNHNSLSSRDWSWCGATPRGVPFLLVEPVERSLVPGLVNFEEGDRRVALHVSWDCATRTKLVVG